MSIAGALMVLKSSELLIESDSNSYSQMMISPSETQADR